MAVFQVAEHAVVRELDGSTIALNLESGQYYTMNKMGTHMWALLEKLNSIDETVEAIVIDYDVSKDEAESDLLGLIDSLKESGLIDTS